MLEVVFTVLVSCIGAIGLFLVIGWYIYVQKFNKYFKCMSGPTPLPLLGSALMFKDTSTVLQTFGKIFQEHGKIAICWIGILPIVALADHEAIQSVLSSSELLEKSKVYKVLESWLGTGLLTSGGAKWKKRRRMLTPTYHFKILEEFVPTFDKIGNNLISELRNAKDKNCLDIYPYVTLATLDIICETAMGVPINALQNKYSSYVTNVHEMSRITIERLLSAVERIDFLYQFTKNKQKEIECLKVLHGHTLSVIEQRRKDLGNKTINDTTDEFNSKRKVAFLDMLLQMTDNGIPLSDDDIREEVDTFMLEGHDTTSTCLSFALYEIGNHPEIQKKILQEQIEIFGNENREETYQDLANMRYLDMVIKETLRLYPPVPIFGREANEDTRISDDILLPKGCTIAIIAYQVHRDPCYFPNPEIFDPDRFQPENHNHKNPYSFIPFSAGPRNCIGQKFAMLEIKSVLSKVIRHFEILPVVPAHQMKLVVEAVLKSNNGVMIKIKERN